jgi:delta24-sterol reductase
MFSTDAFMADHATAVAAISSQVNSFHARKAPFRIYHGSTNSTRASSRNTSNTVDCSTLNHVLRVDRAAKTAWVEPNIAMDQLVEATLKEGLLPKVVMEFPGITVGGGWNGTSGESSSFRQGFFDGTVAKVEIVLPSGEVVVATNENEYADLYRGSSSAVGTLGVTTLLEVRLVEARRYVELTYHPIKSMDEGVHRIKETIEDKSVEYCDGILFSKDEGVICTGKLVDEASTPGTPVQRFSRAHDQWFYIQAQKNVTSHPDPAMPKVELVPVVDYFFRYAFPSANYKVDANTATSYNRGGFWVGTLGTPHPCLTSPRLTVNAPPSLPLVQAPLQPLESLAPKPLHAHPQHVPRPARLGA